MNLNSLKDVYIHQLKDMYSAEKQLTEALPKMAKAASSPKLRTAYQNHLNQTQEHMATVRHILAELDKNPSNTKCEAMEALIKEGSEIIREQGQADAKDAALVVAAQKVEHYEIASYGSLVTFANALGYEDTAATLQDILNEEYKADEELDKLAMGLHQSESKGLNVKAKK